MKKDLAYRVEKMFNNAQDLFKDYIRYYEKKYGINLHDPTLTFYTIDICCDYSSLSGFIDSIHESKMLTLQYPCGDKDPDLSDEEQIISYITSTTLISYQTLFEIILDCNMHFANAEKYIAHMLKHEVGHMIDHNFRFIGKPMKVWNDAVDSHQRDLAEFDAKYKLRKNASLRKRLEYNIIYHTLIPAERDANKYVHIHERDIVEAFNLVNTSMQPVTDFIYNLDNRRRMK